MPRTFIISILSTIILQACDNSYENNVNIPEQPIKEVSPQDKQMQAIVNASGYDCSTIEGSYAHSDGKVTVKCSPVTSTPSATYVLEFGMVKK